MSLCCFLSTIFHEYKRLHSDICFVVAKFTITIPKANPGEYFHDLNLLSKLLAPSGETSAKPPKIEVLGQYYKHAQNGGNS